MNYIQKTERSLNSLAKEAVRLGRDLSREAHSACVGGNATDFGFVTRSLRRLAERDPFDPQNEASFGALNRILEADLDKEITGTERRFVETYFDHFGQHGEMQDVPVYSDRGEHLLRVRNLLAAFLEARAAALDPIAAETALLQRIRS